MRKLLTRAGWCALVLASGLGIAALAVSDGSAAVTATVLQWIDSNGAAVSASAANPLPIAGVTGGGGGASALRVQSGATKIVSVQFTRPSNTTAYAAGQAVCASTSVDCTGLVFAGAGRAASGGGLIHGIQLIKSGIVTTNASFSVVVYQAPPTITGIKDASVYSPTFADVTSNAYRGVATCTGPTVNGDNATYQCIPGNPNGTMAYVADGNNQLYAMIQANGAYPGASGEKFQVSLGLMQD